MSNNFDVGVYSVALQVSGGLGILMMSINQAWAPILFERLNTDSSIENKLQIVRLTYKIMLVMLLLSITFMFALPFVYKFFIDVNYHGGIMISLLLVIAFLLQGFYFMVTNYILYSKKTKYLSAITVSSSLLILILNYSLIMNYNMLGAAYAMILTNLILFLSVWFFSNKIFKMPWLLNEK
jgi:O-antigen/teichoic acid export membrane protein